LEAARPPSRSGAFGRAVAMEASRCPMWWLAWRGEAQGRLAAEEGREDVELAVASRARKRVTRFWGRRRALGAWGQVTVERPRHALSRSRWRSCRAERMTSSSKRSRACPRTRR